ncbi:tyrosine-type recombinase/integrase [Rossellomorea sp. SC111]|uniref:tyrosine-type recombinase/integrase n=1 Tax=Rossellomorea sp. SC111 TaxID=2968985 RepID=UPI00215A9B7D|nr:tyrosine-type recombinase/integrase [Rossellomorea sp. SC111]MCR8847765.1 tyrosine-type recombinase/integrase [Rossellomorea sp. SC111]
MISSEECIQNFILEYSFRLNEKTIDLYQKAVRQLFNHCEKVFNEVSTKEIRNWINYLDDNDYKPATINSKLFGIKLFYKYCAEEGLISSNPAVAISLLELEDSLPHYLQVEQLMQLRKMVEGNTKERAIIEVLYSTGIRLGELISLRKENINWSERLINIENGKRKKGRIVLFTNMCAEHLKIYLHQRKDDLPYVFTNATSSGPVVKRSIQSKFETYEKNLGIRLTPHTLRHTFAAHLAQKGMPIECIQVLLGHISPYQTQIYARLYSHARKMMYDEWM